LYLICKTRMWANAQRDDHRAEYRWRFLFNAAVWLTPTTWLPCSNAAKTRNQLKFAGVPETNETISAVSGPKFNIQYCEGMWGRYCCLTSFFPIVDKCLSCKGSPTELCGGAQMGNFWRFFAYFCILYYQRATCSTFQTCIVNSHEGHVWKYDRHPICDGWD